MMGVTSVLAAHAAMVAVVSAALPAAGPGTKPEVSAAISLADAKGCGAKVCDGFVLIVKVHNESNVLYCVPGDLAPADLHEATAGSLHVYDSVSGKRYEQISQRDYTVDFWSGDLSKRISFAREMPQLVLQPGEAHDIEITSIRDFRFSRRNSRVTFRFLAYPCQDSTPAHGIYVDNLDAPLSMQHVE